MTKVILANIIAFIGLGLLCLASFAKTQKKMLAADISNNICSIIANGFLLGGTTAIVIGGFSILRSCVAMRKKPSKVVTIVIVTLSTCLSLILNQGLVGLLPVVSNLVYSTLVLCTKDTNKLKLGLSFTSVCWMLYGLCLHNYTSFGLNTLLLACNIVYFIKAKKRVNNPDY